MKDKVIIYTTQWCNVCHSVMDWFEKTGVEYEEKNAENDTVRKEISEKMGKEFTAAPVTVIGDEIIHGFNRPAILAALEKCKAEK